MHTPTLNRPIAVPASLKERLRSAWDEATHSERVVFGIIALLPLWWAVGFGYIYLLLIGGLIASELWRYGRIRLKAPRPEVWALLAFGVYVTVNTNLHVDKITGNTLLSPSLLWIGGGLVLWYIQSNSVRVRLKVVLWALALLMTVVLSVWFLGHFIIGESRIPVGRSLTGLLLAKQERFVEGIGDSNYLRLFDATNGTSFIGTSRFGAFFGHPEFGGQAMAAICLFALSGPGSWPLFLGSAALFGLLIDGARSSLAVLVLLVGLRYLVLAGRGPLGIAFVGLFAIASFAVLSVPPITDRLVETYQQSVESSANLRRKSTEARSLIYQRTLDSLEDSLLFGHGVPGRTVIPGYEPAKVGSHSFLLGSLLYCSGLVGTALFGLFGVLYLNWLWRTRADRPDCVLWTMLLFMILALPVAFDTSRMSFILLCTMLCSSRSSALDNRSVQPSLGRGVAMRTD
ncbi:O-antigen ligase family protein [Gloeobacter morelensis]|uniref:O-antigen ligase family protein n=1 Tax=Gloeobacter morelensis MG652769 TaxID=2781736 RepID=A0ABY3PP78_9CYAN|nr:O-antigen ligase family protein [Gloeobacter morelensis]UFP95430.1 O-antigen ligase family protein [Gloeobacter morelensis MG652769]